MSRKWSAVIDSESINRFIDDHGLCIHDIKIQPFLGNDIRWEYESGGWIIMLYPRLYYDGPVEKSILHALATISRRNAPRFEETPADDFNRLKDKFLDQRPNLADKDREPYAEIIVSIDSA